MQNNILFFQSTSIGGTDNQTGLLELLLAHLDTLNPDIFEQIQIIVPSQLIAIWLKDQITLKKGICANIDCVVLPGPVLDNIYLLNNPDTKLFNFAKSKYIIYDYLCNNRLEDADDLNNYIYIDDNLDKLRAYQLSSQLSKIFHEYMYLRTNELINLDKSSIKPWQKKIINHLYNSMELDKTFLDVYQYFLSSNLDEIKLPRQLIIFGLTSIYPSQLQLINKLSTKLNVYWYYQTCSFEYYGDLLSDRAKSKLEQKLLKKPDLSLDDLYLEDGNPLLANLAQQSREFTELLIANGIEVYSFDPEQEANHTTHTLLGQLQDDIRKIKYRIHPNYRFGSNLDIYADPIAIDETKLINNNVYDLPNNQTSIKINICHNRMREVQVMFNELAELLNKNPEAKLNEILITAPDIDDYAPYIAAVFDNEAVTNHNSYKLYYNITGNRRYKNYKILETLKILLNAPYALTVNYFIEILIQSEIQGNLEITANDVDTVRKWLFDNNTHFGYDKNDYSELGYTDYQVSSFKQFLNNLVLGACISNEVWDNDLPLYQANTTDTYIPYDNLDNAQVKLCNKLIILIDQLETLRDFFYINSLEYKELPAAKVYECLNSLSLNLLKDDNSINSFATFLGDLLQLPEDTIITLPILNLMIDEYINDFRSNFSLNGSITCASMRYVRNIPFKYVYTLGLNFGEYPNSYTPNSLSILANEWYLADRNYNIEDKQTFLDLILSCQKQLYFSYIGRCETDNSEIKPSPILGLFINTLGQSFSTFQITDLNAVDMHYDYKNLMILQALHPFHNNKQPNYSSLWHKISQAGMSNEFDNKIWDFSKISPVNNIRRDLFFNPTIDKIVRLFLYTNTNLYSAFNIHVFDSELELNDTESLSLNDRGIAKQVYKYFEKYLAKSETKIDDLTSLEDFLITSGTLGYSHIGKTQFEYYYTLYRLYVSKRGNIKASLQLDYKINEDIQLKISDEVYIENSKIIITDSFTNLYRSKLSGNVSELPYALKFKGLITYLLWVNHGSITQNDNKLNIDGVKIREIAINGESQDFEISVINHTETLNRVLKYYVRSLTNPILIHKNAIEEYAKQYKWNKPLDECLNKAKTRYVDNFNNFDLNKIKDDMIFGNIAEDYFEIIQDMGGVNDIVQIGNILATLE